MKVLTEINKEPSKSLPLVLRHDHYAGDIVLLLAKLFLGEGETDQVCQSSAEARKFTAPAIVLVWRRVLTPHKKTQQQQQNNKIKKRSPRGGAFIEKLRKSYFWLANAAARVLICVLNSANETAANRAFYGHEIQNSGLNAFLPLPHPPPRAIARRFLTLEK